MTIQHIDNLIATPDGDQSWGADLRGSLEVTRTNFLSRFHALKGQAGISTWDGSTWTWTGNLNIIPGLRTSTYITVGSKALTVWDLAYVRLTKAQWGNTAATTDNALSPADIQVASYETYVPDLNDIPLAFFNGNDGRLYLTDGRILDYWRTPTFEAGWSDYGGIHACRYTKVGDIVHLKGLANSAGAGTSTVYVLPVGYRPDPAHGHLYGANTAFGLRRWDVRPATGGFTGGQVIAESGGNGWFSLEASFPAKA